MKSFIAALILLLLLVSAVTVNSIYVRNICEDISEHADQLSKSGYDESKVSQLLALWEKHEKLLGFSVEEDELKRMNDILSSLPTFKEKASSDELVRACGLISSLSDELASYERISLESIF
jgi:hypothetical protein